MTNMTFTEQMDLVRVAAISYIKGILNIRGTNYELIDPQDIEDELPDEFYELPRSFFVGKHGIHDEYAITVINLDNDELSFKGVSVDSESDKTDMTFTTAEISSTSICTIADLVSEFEN